MKRHIIVATGIIAICVSWLFTWSLCVAAGRSEP